jgi:uncharacterized protein YecT (DUF1311 family)
MLYDRRKCLAIKYSPSPPRGIARPGLGWNGAVAPQDDLETPMRLMVLSACLAVLAAAPAARAQECDRNDDSQQMMNICADADYQAADARLNKTYKDLVGEDDEKTNKLLQAAQRAWISFRDAECAYSTADSEGGSIHPLEVSQCLTELTNERVKQLTSGRNCQEGDASCSSPDEDEDQDMQ